MTVAPQTRLQESNIGLRIDIVVARAVCWITRAEPMSPEMHYFLSDRYGRLARIYSRRGKKSRAQRFDEKAAYHFALSGVDEPPPAAASAMAVPRPPSFTWAVGRPGSSERRRNRKGVDGDF